MEQAARKGWYDRIVLDLGRQMRWSFVPPLMVYLAYGVSTLTAIVGTFFVKDYLGLSAAFLAGLGFWAGIPWALKMPLGHLVVLMWRWKSLLIFVGAALISASLGIMYLLITRPDAMGAILPPGSWYVTSVILAPAGYVIQDAVADAMSVEAVPTIDEHGRPVSEEASRAMHTTMQTLGRFALISGTVGVALLNIVMFSGAEGLPQAAKAAIYARIYLIAQVVPLLSISGVVLAALERRARAGRLRRRGVAEETITAGFARKGERPRVNHWYFTGGLAFVGLSLAVGLSEIAYGQELIFLGSMLVVVFLMHQLARNLAPAQARALFGTAIIIFVFRAVPLPGAGYSWFAIDQLGFDEQFLSILSLITSVLTLAGIIVLRPMMASHTITWIVVLLSLAEAVLSLPNIGLYYGIQNWTAPLTGGVVDARFIAIIDTAAESPLGQIAMIPMLAWIARNAPDGLKATFFAVMASFTNLALSASSLGTRYMNEMFHVAREVRDPTSGNITVPADYSQLGLLLIVVAVITVAAPLIAIVLVQASPLRTRD